MTGETDLKTLLASMTSELLPGVHVFVTLAPGVPQPEGLEPVMVFREREGLTLIVTEDKAKAAGLAASFRCRMITLNIHSSLEAVGFLAAITARLAAAGMGVIRCRPSTMTICSCRLRGRRRRWSCCGN
jgi:hypothetical protein